MVKEQGESDPGVEEHQDDTKKLNLNISADYPPSNASITYVVLVKE